MTALKSALKEWSVAVEALAAGDTLLLLRKGGIREAAGQFTVPYSRVILYPTYEHQQPDWLKPKYAQTVKPVASGWHPETISLRAWAEIADIFQVSEPSSLDALQPFHIWQEAFATERFKWKPQQPLYVLLLRVYRLANAVEIPYHSSYSGCRSWLELQTAIAVDHSYPALSESDFNQQRHRLQALMTNSDDETQSAVETLKQSA
ncbi:MAG: DUF1802 family protein [Leptolyngbyaceae cyanobacterium SM1_1_3]|nr:DUF1802 family protein [Leptolyngbyaceae cyanobacterium SM1_1_3]NJN03380.1 DUF1802 family protein [Leptolyngbyaceae cyanobacterium RM1_1_2]NJO10436.1 DUF1802 family protein [Leptolyngbyaceae cyanobacterium SL_1_1]